MSEQLGALAGVHDYVPEYYAAPVAVVSSPVVDAAVIEGRARGYVDGLKAAQEHADALERTRQAEHERALRAQRERIDHALGALERAAAELTGFMGHGLDDAEDRVFEAGCRVAGLVLDAELSDASVAARAVLRRALTAPTPSPVHTVRLHPDALRAAQEGTALPAGVVLQADPALPPGGAVALYRDGWLEAGLEDALERVRDYAGGGRQ